MIVTVLGCSGAIAAGCKTTSFLLDGDILIDAGTGVGDLPLADMARVDHILISHSHLDHILAIGLLADAVLRIRRAAGRPPIQVHALPETLQALRSHIFNGVIWPDFTRLPTAEAPVLVLRAITVGEVLRLSGKRIEVLSAAHTVPAVGFAVAGRREGDRGEAQDADASSLNTGESPRTDPRHPDHSGPGADIRWWVYTGDTGPNPRLWARLRRLEVSHLVIETAFSDEEEPLARLSQHLCPSALGEELAQLHGSVDVRITHIKPGETAAVMSGIADLTTAHRVSALAQGQVMRLG